MPSLKNIESLTASLVREYLNRKGLKTTLQVMDEESPRDEDSISNRQLLVKELHIEKIMKKNKEQSQPLKAMLEVITQYLIGKKVDTSQKLKNGEIEPANYCPGSMRSSLSSAQSSRTQYPQFSTKEDTQITFDGYPTSQQEDDDDLLKPDPNFTYPSHRSKPKKMPMTVTKKSNHNDLVIEDSHEGETLLGQGKSGVLQQIEEDQLPNYSIQSRPKSTAKPRNVGVTGPVTSTEENSRRKYHKPRPMSASKNQRLNLFENDSPKISSLDNISTSKPTPKSTVINSKPLQNRETGSKTVAPGVEEIETIISSNDRKKSIQDVLDIERQRPPSATRRQSSIEKETSHYTVDKSSIAGSKEKKASCNSGLVSQSSSSNSSLSMKVGDVEMGDIDDLDQDLAKLDVGPKLAATKVNKSHHNSKPIDVKTAVALKTLIFGTPMQSFSDEWKYQSFSFCDMPKLKYGIVQKKRLAGWGFQFTTPGLVVKCVTDRVDEAQLLYGGPCGILASVQAFVLQELLFGDRRLPLQRFNEPSYGERTEGLAVALAKIFWRAGGKRKAIVCLPSGRPVIGSGGKFRADEFIETLTLNSFIDFDELSNFMKQVVSQYELDGLGGVVMSLYSVILSRKIDGVREDMDEPTNKLMGAHGYCTQDMVNLYLSGRAVSNVFNDVMELDSGEGNIMILKGIVSRCDVGLLSLFEHYKSCQVGTYLKTPRSPIWVVCSESHFSCLFCPKKELTSDWKAEKRFDLYYYDGLARQQEEIRLTIDTNSRTFKPPSEEELVPPIDHCIRTKWEGAEVNWNGTEPLL